MFVRKKSNPSGVVSVQVIDKSNGTYKVIKTIGSSDKDQEVKEFFKQGEQWVRSQQGIIEIDFAREQALFESFTQSIQKLQLAGPDLLVGRIFDEIGFNQVKDEVFRYLCIYRVCFPRSKLKTTEYLYRYHQIDWNEDKIYHYLDKLYNTQKEIVQQISYQHTLKVLKGQISIVFYDVTTLYFEIDTEDELRKTGFSKEGKHQNPQIVLGLLVSKNGYPLAYEIFEGDKFEGHTMLPVLDGFKNKYGIGKLVVIADAGLLSKANIKELCDKDYAFILGARIKNETQAVRDKILSLQLKNGESQVIELEENKKLIVSYSSGRAKKDAHNRERGLRRIKKLLKSGRLTKSAINNKGYNKFLKMTGEITLALNDQKLSEDAAWDGLKGYVTNTSLLKEEIIENYGHLWRIEQAFRVSKTDLKIRPVYHRLQRRIEAHICITFVAYKIYKELERQLKQKKSNLSAEKALEIAASIFEITIQTPNTKDILKRTLLLNDEQKGLATLFGF
jgi:transposase